MSVLNTKQLPIDAWIPTLLQHNSAKMTLDNSFSIKLASFTFLSNISVSSKYPCKHVPLIGQFLGARAPLQLASVVNKKRTKKFQIAITCSLLLLLEP